MHIDIICVTITDKQYDKVSCHQVDYLDRKIHEKI